MADSEFFVPNGKDGADGNSITSVGQSTDENGNIVITINFSKTEPITVTIPKGTDGEDGNGIKEIISKPGKDENGNEGQWIIIKYTDETMADSEFFVPNGKDGSDGEDGNSITSVDQTTDKDGNIVITINFSKSESITVTIPKGTAGEDGEDGEDGKPGQDGEDGITPKLRVNTETNEWEISYDDGKTWTSLGIKATGSDGENAIAPQLRINEESNEWEVSYDEGKTWTSLGIKATGSNGSNAIAPQLRINEETNEWEVSYDEGKTWTSLGVKATGDKGDTGADGNDNNKIVILCIGIAALCIIVTIVAVSTRKFRRPWWILC